MGTSLVRQWPCDRPGSEGWQDDRPRAIENLYCATHLRGGAMAQGQEALDVAIVGAGIGGLIALHYARRAGLRARVFEAQPGVGGLWRNLPAWQDIQIAAADWTVGDLPIAG